MSKNSETKREEVAAYEEENSETSRERAENMEVSKIENNESEENITEEIEESPFLVERVQARDYNNRPITTERGEPIFNYVMPVEISGRKFKINFKGKGVGIGNVLEFVYEGQKTANLKIKNITSEMNGKKQTRVEYILQNIDSTGLVRECVVKLLSSADLCVLNMYRNYIKLQQKQG